LKLDPFAFKIPGPVVGPVVYKVVPEVEVLVMGKDQPFTGRFPQVFFYPQQLVNPGRLVIPGCGGEDVGVEPLRKPGIAFKGVLHGERVQGSVFRVPGTWAKAAGKSTRTLSISMYNIFLFIL